MEQATEENTTRVTPERVRGIVNELRTALAAVGVNPAVLRTIIPTEDITGVRLIRTGTWDLASVAALTAALATARPPLIGRADLPPILPPRS